MSNYPDNQETPTNTKDRRKRSMLVLLFTYLAVWAISIIVFWFFTSDADAFGYSLVFLWCLLPVTTFVISVLIGRKDYFGMYKWFASVVFGILYMLAEYATFSTANMVAFDKMNAPQIAMIPIGAAISIGD